MPNTKRPRWMAASAVATALTLTACGGGGGGDVPTFDLGERYTPDASTPAWQLDTKEELTELTWYVNADWWNDSWGADLITKKMQEDLNVSVTFIKGDDTTMNTMFASGELPDIVTTFDANSKVATGAHTWAWSLDELAEAYDPHWFEVAAEDTLNWHRLADGHVYAYPNYSNTRADYENGTIPGGTAFLVRKDVYDALGQPAFGTQEEFVAGMRAIRQDYPDLIPFGFNAVGGGTGSLGDTLQDYIGVPLEAPDGSYYNRNLDEDYLSWVNTLRQVHDDRNISDDSFADDGTAFEEKLQTGRYATILLNGLAQASGFLQTWMSDNPGSEYIAIQGPVSTAGNRPTLSQSGITGWMLNFVSKQAKDPAKAMQVFTYLQSEYGQMLTAFGIEGETFTWTDEGRALLLPEIMDMKSNDNDRFKKELRLGEFMFFGHDRYNALADDSMAIQATIQPMNWGREFLYPHFLVERIDPAAGTAEARNLTGINTTWSNTLVTLIRGSEADFPKTIKAYEDFLAANGWDAIVETRTENMQRNRELLGIS